MFIAKYYSVELNKISADLFKMFLRENAIKFEPSSCYDLVHFEVFIPDSETREKCDNFLRFLP